MVGPRQTKVTLQRAFGKQLFPCRATRPVQRSIKFAPRPVHALEVLPKEVWNSSNQIAPKKNWLTKNLAASVVAVWCGIGMGRWRHGRRRCRPGVAGLYRNKMLRVMVERIVRRAGRCLTDARILRWRWKFCGGYPETNAHTSQLTS